MEDSNSYPSEELYVHMPAQSCVWLGINGTSRPCLTKTLHRETLICKKHMPVYLGKLEKDAKERARQEEEARTPLFEELESGPEPIYKPKSVEDDMFVNMKKTGGELAVYDEEEDVDYGSEASDTDDEDDDSLEILEYDQPEDDIPPEEFIDDEELFKYKSKKKLEKAIYTANQSSLCYTVKQGYFGAMEYVCSKSSNPKVKTIANKLRNHKSTKMLFGQAFLDACRDAGINPGKCPSYVTLALTHASIIAAHMAE